MQSKSAMPDLSPSTHWRSLLVPALAVLVLTLQACSESDDGNTGNTGSANGLVPPTAGGTPADDVSTERLQADAARAASGALVANLDVLQQLADDDDTLPPGMDSPAAPLSETGGDTESFLQTTIGVDQPGAMVTRQGNVITIDPDEAAVCQEGVPLTEVESEDTELCRQLAADLIVTIEAFSDESGLITYLFQNIPALLIGYAPDAANYEIRLPGVQALVRRADELQGLEPSVPSTFNGALTLASKLTNTAPGAEAGQVSLQVTEAIDIRDVSSPAAITLQPSTVVAADIDAADRSARLSVDWGALSITSESGDDLGNSSVSTIALGGLSGSLGVSEGQPDLRLENLGIGGVPLTITIDSVESLVFGFETLGVSVDNETGELTVDGALGVSLAINNLAGLLEKAAPEFTASLQLAAPDGTSLLKQENDRVRVTAGGPVTSSFIASDNQNGVQSESSIAAGSCFEAGASDDDDDAIVEAPGTAPGSQTTPAPDAGTDAGMGEMAGLLNEVPCN